jgi:hypothetical protein
VVDGQVRDTDGDERADDDDGDVDAVGEAPMHGNAQIPLRPLDAESRQGD